jgi:hypothetical protein
MRKDLVTSDNLNSGKGQFLVYESEDGQVKIDVRLEDETVWLTQQLMADLFQTTKQNISLHIQRIFEEGELVTEARVKSHVATRFRIWATQRLREYIVKGFVLDDERLKNPDQPFDYFDELLRRIQDIRTSERRFYQKITDIYATSIDYDPTLEISIEFFKTVQNKMHWAITGMTAAEIIHDRADSDKTNMGLTSWRGAKVRKQDVTIAKNYLTEKELLALNNLVEQYLIFAEGQAMRRIPMHMADWVKKLDAFLTLNEREILNHAGRISHEMAKEMAEAEYEQFNRERIRQKDHLDSDFDKTVKQLTDGKRGKKK